MVEQLWQNLDVTERVDSLLAFKNELSALRNIISPVTPSDVDWDVETSEIMQTLDKSSLVAFFKKNAIKIDWKLISDIPYKSDGVPRLTKFGDKFALVVENDKKTVKMYFKIDSGELTIEDKIFYQKQEKWYPLLKKPTVSFVTKKSVEKKKQEEKKEKLNKTKLNEMFDISDWDKFFENIAIERLEWDKNELKIISFDKETSLYSPASATIEIEDNAIKQWTTIQMPKLFWFERTYEYKGSKFVETDSSKERIGIVKKQKAEIDAYLKNAWWHIINNSWEVSDIDVDGNYTITFDSSAVRLWSWVEIPSLKDQTFKISFSGDNMSIVDGDNYVTDKRWVTDRFILKDKVAYFNVWIDKSLERFNVFIKEKKENKEKIESEYKISWLPSGLSWYYNKVGDYSLNVIWVTEAGRYVNIAENMELKKIGNWLKNPTEIEISPYWDVEWDNKSKFIKDIESKYKEIFYGLKWSPYNIDLRSFISEQNVSLKENVYKIRYNNKDMYYTAEKDWNKIKFKQDKDLDNRIIQAQNALDGRLLEIQTLYNKEQSAQKKLKESKFESLESNGAYNIGFAKDEKKQIKLEKELNQKNGIDITSDDYDPQKVSYSVPFYMEWSKQERQDRGKVYFDYRWEFDKDKNRESEFSYNGYEWYLWYDWSKILFVQKATE